VRRLECHNPRVHGTCFCEFRVAHDLLYASGWAQGRVIAIGIPHGYEISPVALHFAHRMYQTVSRKQYILYAVGRVAHIGEMVCTNLSL
jgi:hypothetical protein